MNLIQYRLINGEHKFFHDYKEIINPDLLPTKHEFTPEGIHYTYDGKVLKHNDTFPLPEDLKLVEEEIDTVEDGGGCYVAGSRTVLRLVKIEKEESQEDIIKSIWERFKGSEDYPDYHQGLKRVMEIIENEFAIHRK